MDLPSQTQSVITTHPPLPPLSPVQAQPPRTPSISESTRSPSTRTASLEEDEYLSVGPVSFRRTPSSASTTSYRSTTSMDSSLLDSQSVLDEMEEMDREFEERSTATYPSLLSTPAASVHAVSYLILEGVTGN